MTCTVIPLKNDFEKKTKLMIDANEILQKMMDDHMIL